MWIDILNIFFFATFLLFAYFNLNDPDWWVWVPIYVVPAVLCLLTVFSIEVSMILIILSVIYGVYAIVLFFIKDGVWDWIRRHRARSIVQSMQADKPYIERTREFFGLCIVIGVMLFNYFI